MSGTPTKRVALAPMDIWNLQEQLALASAVIKSGENWACVSRTIKSHFEKSRPIEWFSPKNCARQYSALLDKVEKPKRKRGSTESTVQSIVRILKDERIKELKSLITQGQDQYVQMDKEIKEIENGNYDNNLSEFSDDIKSDSDIESDISESSASTRLSDTKEATVEDKSSNVEDKKILLEPSDSQDQVKDAVTEVVDNDGDTSVSEKPSSSVSSSSTPRKATSGSPNVSPQLKNLVHTAIAGASEDDRPKNMSPTSAPTLSMLLEMPPRDRGQPLPEIPSFMGTPNKSPVGEKVPETISTLIADIKDVELPDVTITLKPMNHHNDVDKKENDILPLGNEKEAIQLSKPPPIKDEPLEIILPLSVATEINVVVETAKPKEVVVNDQEMDTDPVKQITGSVLPEETLKVEPSEAINKIDDTSKEKVVEEAKLPLNESSDSNSKNEGDKVEPNESLPIVKEIEEDSSSSALTKEPTLIDAPAEPSSSEKEMREVDQKEEPKDKITEENKESDQNTVTENDPMTITSTSDITKKSSPKRSNDKEGKTNEDEQKITSTSEVSNVISESEEKVVEPSPAKTVSNKEDADNTAMPLECNNTSISTESPKEEEIKPSADAVSTELEVKSELVAEKACDSSTTASSENTASPTKSSASSVDAKVSTSEQEQDAASVEKAKNHYIGRGKKAFVVTIVENERGEKVELKTADGASIKVTRNLSKETGLKIEDLPYSKKSTAANKEKEDTPSVVSTPTKRRGHFRSGNTSEANTKESSKNSTPQGRQSTSNKKGSMKALNSEVKTPNLRSRGGPTPTPTKDDAEKDKPVTLSDTNHSASDGDNDKKPEPKPNEDKKESTLSPSKPIEEPVVPETPKEKEKEKEKEKVDSDDTEDEFSDALSELDNKKDNSDTEDDADESDSSRNVSSKKSSKSRKERLESADMADDDSSNSANDATTKKRITRRSAKVSPRKSDSKLKNSEEKSSFRHRDRLSLPVKDSKSESKIGRSSKALSRVKHLSEEASLIYGDLETQTGDGYATRITRARAKTSSSTPTFPSASKNVTPSSEPETSSDTENKARSTRSRTAAAVATTTSSNSVIDQLPPVTVDSNPSSPCSSTTNSTIIDEDKDQRAFRKSIMVVWNRIAAHKFSSLFLKPISDDKAPGYLEKVKRPMDLATIKRNVETGQIRSYRAFERDIFLMFMNAMMFNPADHEVSKMSKEMERDVRVILEDHQRMFPECIEGLTPIHERFLRQNARVLFPSLESSRLSDSEPEMEEIAEKKMNTSNSNRKRRAGSNELETPEVKKRKTRTSAANSNSSSRKIKPQVSPDIVSASYDM